MIGTNVQIKSDAVGHQTKQTKPAMSKKMCLSKKQ